MTSSPRSARVSGSASDAQRPVKRMETAADMFTAHNILLDDGRQTRPDSGFLLYQAPVSVTRGGFPDAVQV
jgi:hypothetical protein